MDNKRDYEDDDLLQVLLEHPPVNQAESNAYWNAIQTKQGTTTTTTGINATNDDSANEDEEEEETAAAAMALL